MTGLEMGLVKNCQVSWLIGKSSALHAADTGSILGRGDEMAKKIDRFTTFVYFGYGCAGCEKRLR